MEDVIRGDLLREKYILVLKALLLMIQVKFADVSDENDERNLQFDVFYSVIGVNLDRDPFVMDVQVFE